MGKHEKVIGNVPSLEEEHTKTVTEEVLQKGGNKEKCRVKAKGKKRMYSRLQ